MTPLTIKFYDFRRLLVPVLLLFVVGTVSSCASNTIDEAVPMATTQQSSEPQQASDILQEGTKIIADSPPPQSDAPINSGQYPNINVLPKGATSQLTDAETAETRAALEGEALVQRQRGESSEAYIARLRNLQRLGSTHAAATLKQIENSQ